MKLSNNRKTLFSLAALVALSACGGGGGGSSPAFNGRVVDGYISGAEVFCDTNGNLVADSNEMSATTDGQGSFTFPRACGNGSFIIAKGGKDTGTPFLYDFEGMLSARGGSSYVTPITSLLAANPDLEESALLASLGLPSDLKLGTTNPMSRLDLQAKTLAVQQVLQQISNSLVEHTGTGSRSANYDLAAQHLASALEKTDASLFAGTTVNTAILQTAVKSMATELKVADLSDDAINDVAGEIAGQSRAFLEITDDTQVASLVEQLQNPEKPPVVTPAKATNYLALTGNSFNLTTANDSTTTHSLAELESGITVSGSGLKSLEFGYTAAPGDLKIEPKIVQLALQISESGAKPGESGRILQVKVENLSVERASDGTVTIRPTGNTAIRAYAQKADGMGVNRSRTDINFSAVQGGQNALTINFADLIQRITEHESFPSDFDVNQFVNNLKGSFNVKVAIHDLSVRRDGGKALPTVTVGILNTEYAVAGPGIEGRVTIQ